MCARPNTLLRNAGCFRNRAGAPCCEGAAWLAHNGRKGSPAAREGSGRLGDRLGAAARTASASAVPRWPSTRAPCRRQHSQPRRCRSRSSPATASRSCATSGGRCRRWVACAGPEFAALENTGGTHAAAQALPWRRLSGVRNDKAVQAKLTEDFRLPASAIAHHSNWTRNLVQISVLLGRVQAFQGPAL